MNEIQGHTLNVEALVTETGEFVLSFTDKTIEAGAAKDAVDLILVATGNTTRNGRR